jgi:XTP/dITP diphosphohydrolase
MRVALLASSPRVAPGILTAAAWTAVHAGPVYAADPAAAAVAALAAAGAEVRPLDGSLAPSAVAQAVVAGAAATGTASLWLGERSEPGSDRDALTAAIGALSDVEVIEASWDLPGARLLDVVATMDRLRSPGGCPWDAAQDHASLGPYLLEEAYEAFQAIEDADSAALREELGDVLMQVAFHARVAAERDGGEGWTIDDVATGLVAKLVRRHPHVFGDVDVTGTEEVNANWEAIKTAERGDASPLASVPLAAPALTLAATLQRKAARAGLGGAGPTVSLDAAVAGFAGDPSPESAGDLLWRLVEMMCAVGVDPEDALRQRARRFRGEATGAE